MCSLPYPLQLHTRLDSWPSSVQDYPGVQIGVNVHVSDHAYADVILTLSSSYTEMLEAAPSRLA